MPHAPLPDGDRARADVRACGVTLSDAQVDHLLAYLALLQRWNATYNLTAVRDPALMWVQHVLDCLAVVPELQAWRANLPPASARTRVLDVGSGGGLPGVVWAIALPDLELHCVDTVGKKAAFIRQVAAELQLRNLQVHHARVEQLRAGPFNLVTSRAFSSLADLLNLTRPLLKPGGCWLALKGKAPDAEIQATGLAAGVFHVKPIQVPGLDAERCVVWIRNEAAPAADAGAARG